MKYIFKGEKGYFKSRKTKLGIGSLTGFLLMVVTYFIGYLIFDTGKNFVTIIAVLIVLPTVKIFVQYLMIPWYKKRPEDELLSLQTICAPLKLYTELLITASEKNFEIIYLLIDRNDNIIAYTEKSTKNTELFEKGVTNFLNYYNFDSKVKLFTDLKQFEKRAKQLAASNAELTEDNLEHINLVFEKLSIMSI